MNSLQDVVLHLNEVFPESLPSPGDTLEQLMFRAGQRSVYFYLRACLEETDTPQGSASSAQALMKFDQYPDFHPQPKVTE